MGDEAHLQEQEALHEPNTDKSESDELQGEGEILTERQPVLGPLHLADLVADPAAEDRALTLCHLAVHGGRQEVLPLTFSKS